MRQKSVDIFYCTAWASTLVPRNNFANLGSFATVSVPVQSIIPVLAKGTATCIGQYTYAARQ